MPTKFTLNEQAIAGLVAPTGMVTEYLRGLGNQVAAVASATAPVDTGKLKSSILVTERSAGRNGTAIEVSANTLYATYVNRGTRPHVIMPKKAKMLRFPNKAGEIVFANKVNHPGTKPQPFMLNAMLAVIR
jgi:HK97 gp10 family phage protein